MATNAIDLNMDYSIYSGEQLSALLDDIQNQRANLDNKERQIREAISSLDVQSRIGLDEPTEETRNALDNDEIVGIFSSHEEFEKSLEMENDE